MHNNKSFNLIEEKFLEEDQAQAYVFEHKKTKARVFVMKNKDDNKLFSIGFRTPPKDSTGVCHILEHCVLNGSKKYRTREPFMDMVKTSLYTFLNAMTYPDKTIYPVASRNKKDFENLMDVYLDAVFNPRVLEDERIFMQEGWRYDLSPDNKLTYKGVVYNEMRGAMSSAEDQVYSQIYKHLYPDTIYSLNSGGDPYQIPSLKYEDFVDFYKDYYHPSNSFIFLYGDTDYKAYMDYVDREYLSKYDYREIDSRIGLQEPFNKSKYIEEEFSTNKEDTEKANMASYTVMTATNDNSYDRIINQILVYALISSESSPLKKAINNLNIVDDIINASTSNRQISFSILGKNIKETDKDLFFTTIENSLKDLAENGIDRDLLLSIINIISFSLKEKNENPTKGIEYLDMAFNTWLYDLSPIDGINIGATLKEIRDGIDDGIFEKYIQDHILNNDHKVLILHKACPNLNTKRDESLRNKLDEIEKNLTAEERSLLHKHREEMDRFQSKEDSQEDKDTIPKLELSDVDTKINSIDRRLIEKSNYSYLTHHLPTAGIDYIDLVFNIDHIEKEDLVYVSMLGDILGMMDTKNYSYSDIYTKSILETGGIRISPSYYILKDTKELKRTLTLSTKVFSENISKGIKVVEEILFNTKIEDKQRLKDLINNIRSRTEMVLLDYGHSLMMNRALASKFAHYDYLEKISGIDNYLFYKDLEDKDLDLILNRLQGLYKKVFNKNQLLIDVRSDFSHEDDLFKSLEGLVEKLDDRKFDKLAYDFEPQVKKEAFIASTDVSYVSVASNLGQLGYEYKGNASVIASLLSNDYLYSEIRAKGGAYGAGMSINNKNGFTTFSYRDPNIKRTLEVYKKVPRAMDDISLSDEALKSFIIGAVGKFSPPLTENQKAIRDYKLYLTGQKYTDLEGYIKEALETRLDDFKEMGRLVDRSVDDWSLAVLTNQVGYEENIDLFDNLVKLI